MTTELEQAEQFIRERRITDPNRWIKSQTGNADILENLPQLLADYAGSRWVAVSERLPDESGEYIVANKYGRSVIRWMNVDDPAYCRNHYNFWMPIPEPPTKEGEEGKDD